MTRTRALMDKPRIESRTYLGALAALLICVYNIFAKKFDWPALETEILILPGLLMGVGIRDAISRNTQEVRVNTQISEAAQTAAEQAAEAVTGATGTIAGQIAGQVAGQVVGQVAGQVLDQVTTLPGPLGGLVSAGAEIIALPGLGVPRGLMSAPGEAPEAPITHPAYRKELREGQS